MFKDDRDLAPISMIITTLAAHAYNGEQDLYSAVTNILDRMPQYVRSQKPRVPNPVNPAEDFADRWAQDQKYERNFWLWHAQAKADLEILFETVGSSSLPSELRTRFKLDLTVQQTRDLEVTTTTTTPKIISATPALSIPSAPKPWRRDA
jgi:hypothetical protein